MATNNGKSFENKVRDALTELRRTGTYHFIRLYDTTSASQQEQVNYLPEQPGDFVLTFPGAACLIEAKSSEVHSSLRSCVSSHVSTGQAANHRLWQRSGNPSVFLFYDMQSKQVECWDGMVVAVAKSSSKPLPADSQLFVCDVKDMASELSAMAAQWCKSFRG